MCASHHRSRMRLSYAARNPATKDAPCCVDGLQVKLAIRNWQLEVGASGCPAGLRMCARHHRSRMRLYAACNPARYAPCCVHGRGGCIRVEAESTSSHGAAIVAFEASGLRALSSPFERKTV